MAYLPDPYGRPASVMLARVPETPENQMWEPQRVRILENASALLICDNSNRTAGNAYNFTVKLASMVQNIRRVAVIGVNWSPPAYNMNLKNNTIVVTFPAGPFVGSHTAQVVVGQYTTVAAAAAAIQTALAPWGISVVATPNNTMIATAANAFYFEPTCPFIVYGEDFHGFIPSSTPALSINSEPSKLIFSIYWAISCPQLTQYEKNNSSASDGVNSDLVAMIFNNDPTKDPSYCLFINLIPQIFRNFEAQTQINYLTFTVRDRWGNDPSAYTNNTNTWQLSLLIQTNV